MNHEFKNIIKAIKYKYKITQGDIADRLNVKTQYLSDIAGGRAPFNDGLRERLHDLFPDSECWKLPHYLQVEEAIMNYMQDNVWSVYDLAERLRVSPKEVTETIAGGFSEATAKKWSEAFGMDKVFLLTGEGQLFPFVVKTVPLIPIQARAGHLGSFAESVNAYDCDRVISPVKDAELAMTITGESMSPEFPSGAVIFIKKINEKAFIEWGKTYVLDTVNGPVIKYLAPGGTTESVRCISANPDPMYAPFEVSLEDVYGIYRVVNSLCMK